MSNHEMRAETAPRAAVEAFVSRTTSAATKEMRADGHSARAAGEGAFPSIALPAAPLTARQPATVGAADAGVNVPPHAEDSPTSAEQAGAGALSIPPRLTGEQRAAVAARMRDLIEREHLAMSEVAARIGMSLDRTWRLAGEYGLRSHPSSLGRVRVSAVKHISAEAAARGREKTQDALSGYRAVISERARAARAEIAERLRALVDDGQTVAQAARALGVRMSKAYALATEFGIKARPDVLARIQTASGQMGARLTHQARRAKGWGEPAPKPAQAEPIEDKRRRNPRLSAAQQQLVDKVKARFWRPALASLPPPTKEEADALVRDFLSKRGATVCPAAQVVIPCNAGIRFK